jgi:serine phosphatase RsbU (regulator of sigma subunit)/HAMP domain-containing protein
MRNWGPIAFFTASLQRKLMLVLTLLVILIMAMAGGYWLNSQQQTASAELEARAEQMADLLGKTLGAPLWNLDQKAIYDQLDAVMADPNVFSASLYESNSPQPRAFRQRAGQPIDAVERTATVVYMLDQDSAPTELGRIRLIYTRQYMYQSLANTQMLILGIVLSLTILLAFSTSLLMQRMVLGPVSQIAALTKRIASGDYATRIHVSSHDEVGQLADSCNQMASQLQDLIDTLEQRVLARTQRLETVATLSGRLNAILEITALLHELVTQVQARFDYYETYIYLLDPASQSLNLRATAGKVDTTQAMPEEAQCIPLTAPVSLVARAARTAQVVRVDNVRADPGWLPDSSFPNTQAEMVVPIIRENQVVGVLGVQTERRAGLDDSDADVLRSLANQVSVALSNAQLFGQITQANAEIRALNERLKSENLRMEAELNVTRQLQQMLLPTEAELRMVESLDIAGFMQPADEIGGDYYDVLQHGNQIKIGIGDVTGHGLESGVVMLMTQTAIRMALTNGETDPVRFLDALNRTLYANLRRMGVDKSITLTLLDYELGRLRLRASGQHEQVIIVRHGGQVELLDTCDLGFPLGMQADIAHFVKEAAIDLKPGDGIVLYSDGITEAQNATGEFYGLEKLCAAISRAWAQPAQAVKEAVLAEVRAFIGQQIVYDDLALLVVKQK